MRYYGSEVLSILESSIEIAYEALNDSAGLSKYDIKNLESARDSIIEAKKEIFGKKKLISEDMDRVNHAFDSLFYLLKDACTHVVDCQCVAKRTTLALKGYRSRLKAIANDIMNAELAALAKV